MKITADLKTGVLVALLTTLMASCGDGKGTTDSGAPDAKVDAKVDAVGDAKVDSTPSDVLVADVPVADVPVADVPVADVPVADVPVADVRVADVPVADVPVADVPVADVPVADVPAADVPAADVLPATYTIGGTISGLTGTGLVLRDNGGDNLTVAANATTFTFATRIAGGGAYAVTVQTQPGTPTQVCTVTAGTGTVAAANVTSVAIACVTQSFTVGGTISGLTATSTGLVLRNTVNGTTIANITVATGATASFVFAAQASGSTYAVTVPTQPSTPTQTCTVANATGTVGAANVTNVTVTCATQAFTVGGTISGLTGAGLVLQNNGGGNLTVAANAAVFTFGTSVASGGAYAATVLTQPAGQLCTITAGSGTVAAANITNVAVACVASTHVVGGTITGLTGTGLILRNNGGDDRTVAANATTFAFATPVASGAAYAVTVFAQPNTPTQICTVTTGSGTVGAIDITSVAITCATQSFTVGGTITGLTGTGLVLRNNAADNRTVLANATTFSFATPVASGAAYGPVTVLTQPSTPTQICTVTTGTASGTVTTGNVTSVAITCVTQSFTVGGTISGLLGTGLVLQNNGADNRTVVAPATTFTFATSVASNASYNATVLTQPTVAAPVLPETTITLQSCSVTGGTGTVGAANVTSVAVKCVVCAQVAENFTLALACPTGHTISSIDFASYGTPTGACGSFALGACAEAVTGHDLGIVRTECTPTVGVESCSVEAINTLFTDPCNGTAKSLWVQATCSP